MIATQFIYKDHKETLDVHLMAKYLRVKYINSILKNSECSNITVKFVYNDKSIITIEKLNSIEVFENIHKMNDNIDYIEVSWKTRELVEWYYEEEKPNKVREWSVQ